MKSLFLKLKFKIRKWLGIDQNTAQIKYLYGELNFLREVIRERTEYHIDVHNNAKHNSQVILIGRFRNNDFVKCYTIVDQDFDDLINYCRRLEKYSHKGKIDAWPEISANIKKSI